jgi:hypothetical protein
MAAQLREDNVAFGSCTLNEGVKLIHFPAQLAVSLPDAPGQYGGE